MYFDEAQELKKGFWMILRLLCEQQRATSTKMWYIFMGTKYSVSWYAPVPGSRQFYTHFC